MRAQDFSKRLVKIGSNQHVLQLASGGTVYFSYNTPILAAVGGKILITTDKYSVTTSRHLNQRVATLYGTHTDTTEEKLWELVEAENA